MNNTEKLLAYADSLEWQPISKMTPIEDVWFIVRYNTEGFERYDYAILWFFNGGLQGFHKSMKDAHFIIMPTTGNAGAVIRELVENLIKAKTDLISIAAQLVRGDDLPSFYQEDHEIKVPKRILNKIEVAYEKQVGKGVKVKKSIDDITSSLTRAASIIEPATDAGKE